MRASEAASELERALRLIREQEPQMMAELLDLVTIPAPPFGEAQRSSRIAERFVCAGLSDVTTDEIGNVIGHWKGGAGPRVMVISHMDTVFPAGTPLVPRFEQDRVFCPGIRDNTAAVASLIRLPQVLAEADLSLPCDLWLASSVGEEGLGDLRGMRKLMADRGASFDAVVVYDGDLGNVVHCGVGSRRFRITYRASGGHSFADFGKPSAVHGLASACAQFCQISLPPEPKTTLNIGEFHGGTSVNAIAQEAVAIIDMRSVSQTELEKLVISALDIFSETAKVFDCGMELEQVGDRPAGMLPADHPLVRTGADVLHGMGITPRLSAASTDANIALSMGIPAICVGSGLGKNVHRPDESLYVPSIVDGLQQLVLLLARLDYTVVPRRDVIATTPDFHTA